MPGEEYLPELYFDFGRKVVAVIIGVGEIFAQTINGVGEINGVGGIFFLNVFKTCRASSNSNFSNTRVSI